MAANVSAPYAGATPGRHTGLRVVVGLLGVAALVIGIVLLFHPMAAARTLALIVALSLVVGGLLEMAVGWDDPKRGTSLLLGAVLVLGGVILVAWPGVTLLTLAWVTGLSLIVHGAARAGVAVVERHEVPRWGWFVLAGAVNVVVGVLAIAWPTATVVVLALVLGIQIALFGLLLLIAAFVRFPSAGTAPAR